MYFNLYSETNNVNTGLLVEVWTKGMIWDRAVGYSYITLDTIAHHNQYSGKRKNFIMRSFIENLFFVAAPPPAQWHSIDQEVFLRDGEVAGTHGPTGHHILLDIRFEAAANMQLELINGGGQMRRQEQYMNNCKKIRKLDGFLLIFKKN